MSGKESFGIMDECYFVPKTVIIEWINNLLGLSLTKIQQLGSGAVYCQIIDVIHPGKIALSKVNWKAKNDYEFISNLKILQSAFEKIGIKRYVEVEKLAKAKYQDNLQFAQWLKRYFDLNGGGRGENYSAEEKRGSAQVDFSFADKNVVPKSYNGSGQIVKNQKTQIIDKMEKKKQPSNIVSAVAQYRNENKSKERKKQNINQNSSSKKPQGKDQHQAQNPKIKQLQQKLQMIRQIAESNESAESRMKLIEQVLNIKTSEDEKKQEKQEKEGKQEQMQEELMS